MITIFNALKSFFRKNILQSVVIMLNRKARNQTSIYGRCNKNRVELHDSLPSTTFVKRSMEHLLRKKESIYVVFPKTMFMFDILLKQIIE